ncbi:PEP-utilizing enzyme [Nonomuraea harbinensis]|uniref:PEP-utilizing enzyme n=1 Tax=Nonomuraea harbinensis TaxID=1286938 RepID=A0ABW1C8L2_9ACTN|nr:PEP-utilizing enzyme [Nonomuraea harbinensis]
MNETARFDYLSEAKTPAGAEGWERMYPYFLLPNKDLRTHEDSHLWFTDTIHWSRGCHPFDSIGAEAVYLGAGQNSARIYAIPTSLGLDVRIVNGYVYISPNPVVDPAEIQERLEHFTVRASYYYENWEELYERWKLKIGSVVDAMNALSFDPLPKFEPVEAVFEARGRSVSWKIIENYHKLIDSFFLVWQHHFEFINLGYGGFLTFFQFCKNAFPSISDQAISRMVAGIDVLAFRPDEELRRLALLGHELGLGAELTARRPAAQTQERLAVNEAGRRWLDELERSKDPWFNYFAEYGFTHDQETWRDNLDLPFNGIARYVEMIERGEDIQRPVDRIRQERDDLVTGYRRLLGDIEAKQFDELLALARRVFPHIEEHNIFVEHWAHSAFWTKMKELGDFLVASGFLAARDDIFYLNRFELDQVLFDVVESWAIGVEPRGTARWRREIEQRRDIMRALQAATPQPAFGTPPAEVTDPLAVMNYGVTTELVQEWLHGASGESTGLSGIPASPGVVEGVVRVLRSEHDLDRLQEGEILVAPITAPSWGSAFSVAKGVITDVGGMMCHAAIVCREYGLPAVVGTGFATTRLKTGQRVRLDGDSGVVELLGGEA